VSEKDLRLKAAARRLLWRMGFTTRVDVPLRAVLSVPMHRGSEADRRSTPSAQAFTDLTY
jgi:hypothetical protein